MKKKNEEKNKKLREQIINNPASKVRIAIKNAEREARIGTNDNLNSEEGSDNNINRSSVGFLFS